MGLYHLFPVEHFLVPRRLSPVTRDIDWLGHMCGHVKKMDDGQATQLHAKVRIKIITIYNDKKRLKTYRTKNYKHARFVKADNKRKSNEQET